MAKAQAASAAPAQPVAPAAALIPVPNTPAILASAPAVAAPVAVPAAAPPVPAVPAVQPQVGVPAKNAPLGQPPFTPTIQLPSLKRLIEALPHTIDERGRYVLNKKPPEDIWKMIFALGHGDVLCGHFGLEKTAVMITSNILFPRIEEAIRDSRSKCPACQKNWAQRPCPDFFGTTVADYPFQKVFIDYIDAGEPPLESDIPYDSVLVMTDRFSGLVHLMPTVGQTAEVTAQAFYDSWICRRGIPEELHSDGQRSLTGKVMGELCSFLKIKHHVGTAYNHQSQSPVERMNEVVERVVRSNNRRGAWHKLLPSAEFAINASKNPITGLCPFEIVQGAMPRLLLNAELGVPVLLDVNADPVGFAVQISNDLKKIFTVVKDWHDKQRLRMDKEAKRRAKGPVDFVPGDYVLVWFPRASQKFRTEFRGPMLIKARDSVKRNIYTVADMETGAEQCVDASRITLFYMGDMTLDEMRREAAPPGEFYVAECIDHVVSAGNYRFYVHWDGYPLLPRDDPLSWVSWKNCRFSPVVRKYVADHRLTPKLH